MMELENNDIKTVSINALNMLKDLKGKIKIIREVKDIPKTKWNFWR